MIEASIPHRPIPRIPGSASGIVRIFGIHGNKSARHRTPTPRSR